MTTYLPDTSSQDTSTTQKIQEMRDRLLPAQRRERLMPIFFAAGLLTVGTVLLKTKPRIGHVPRPKQFGDLPRRSRLRRAAQASRDTVEPFAPSNVTDQIGRSMLIGGAALLITRMLDEAAGRDGK
ncbi:hypothetical protein [Salipiger mucosus]|uniref:Transmembrane protein n=1 Tax=Salipiger mucosus DSM 16094 TaxID=1123237 RepID=S9QIY2_9RHOB|nr:hypothetical protein [Salipiger mucosus]EPX79523.1 hypothetical protein Salmuc_04742 [Salipiger mucosus DSM 16094]